MREKGNQWRVGDHTTVTTITAWVWNSKKALYVHDIYSSYMIRKTFKGGQQWITGWSWSEQMCGFVDPKWVQLRWGLKEKLDSLEVL